MFHLVILPSEAMLSTAAAPFEATVDPVISSIVLSLEVTLQVSLALELGFGSATGMKTSIDCCLVPVTCQRRPKDAVVRDAKV